MCFTLTLLLCIVGVLITGGDVPGNSAEVQVIREELSHAHVEISSLKMEIVRLKEELDACEEGRFVSHGSQSPTLANPHIESHRQTLRARTCATKHQLRISTGCGFLRGISVRSFGPGTVDERGQLSLSLRRRLQNEPRVLHDASLMECLSNPRCRPQRPELVKRYFPAAHLQTNWVGRGAPEAC